MKKILFSVLGLVFAASAAQAKLNVVATTADLGSIAKAVGGEQIELTTLGKATEDPHFVDAKPSFIVKLNHADALVEGGAELEAGWLAPLLEGARNPKLEAGRPGRISSAEGIALLEIPSALDRSQGDIHASGNPHYLTDPLNARIKRKLRRAANENIRPFPGRLQNRIVRLLINPKRLFSQQILPRLDRRAVNLLVQMMRHRHVNDIDLFAGQHFAVIRCELADR